MTQSAKNNPPAKEESKDTANSKESAPSEERSKLKGLLRELSLAVVLFLLLRGTVAEAFVIPSSSMVPTLQIGDRLLINKLSYSIRVIGVTESLYSYKLPARGDVVVFTRPDNPKTTHINESDINIIKRVIALPGEVLEVRGSKVFINSKRLTEDYGDIRWKFGGVRSFGPITVPKGHVVVLGDNRDESKDSRYWDNPFLPVSRIKGRAFVIYWPRIRGL